MNYGFQTIASKGLKAALSLNLALFGVGLGVPYKAFAEDNDGVVGEGSASQNPSMTDAVSISSDVTSDTPVDVDGDSNEDPGKSEENIIVKDNQTVSQVESDVVVENQDDVSDGQLIENSWRYSNGELLTSADGASTDASDDGVATYSAVHNPAGYTVFNWFDRFDKGYCSGDGASKVIDVSEHQGSIDWSKVKASGVNYAIIRCGYGDDYSSQDDKQWIQNVRGCLNNGIPFGIYIYSYAKNVNMAKSEAAHVLRCLSNAGLNASKVALPVFLDMEDSSTLGSDYAAIATAFCNTISNAGYKPGVYASASWWNSYLTASCFSGWVKWVAQWNANSGLTCSGFSSFSNSSNFWQFSDYGSVPGISGAVDLNYTYMVAGGHDLSMASVSSSDMRRNATGSALAPSIAVSLGGRRLSAGTDYAVLYNGSESAPSAPGSYEVTVAGRGSYSGSARVGTFVINDKVASGKVVVSNAKSPSLVLDAEGAWPRNGSNVTAWSANGGSNQVWSFELGSDGYYVIRNAKSPSLVLDAEGAWPRNGSNVTAWSANGGSNQKWVVEPAGDGCYVIRNAKSPSLVLDAEGAWPRNGSNVTAWSANGGSNQKWKINKQ